MGYSLLVWCTHVHSAQWQQSINAQLISEYSVQLHRRTQIAIFFANDDLMSWIKKKPKNSLTYIFLSTFTMYVNEIRPLIIGIDSEIFPSLQYQIAQNSIVHVPFYTLHQCNWHSEKKIYISFEHVLPVHPLCTAIVHKFKVQIIDLMRFESLLKKGKEKKFNVQVLIFAADVSCIFKWFGAGGLVLTIPVLYQRHTTVTSMYPVD